MASAAFTSPGTTGVAAFRGTSPIAGPSGWARSPCCRVRTRSRSTTPCGRILSNRHVLLITNGCWSLRPRTRSWRTTRIGCVRGCCAATGCRKRRSIEKHIAVIGNRPAMAAAISWRARDTGACAGGPHARADDAYLGRCRRHGRLHGGRRHRRVLAPLAGVGHYAADQVPGQVYALMLAHLARHPV